MGKLSALGTETTFSLGDFFIKVKAAGGGDVLVTLQSVLNAIGGFGALTAYTPTITGLSLGNGTCTIYWVQIGKMVFCHLKFAAGSSTTYSGAFTFTLPVVANANHNLSYTALGSWQCNIPAVLTSIGNFRLGADTSHLVLEAWNASSTYVATSQVTNSVPGTWNTTSTVDGYFMYEAA